MGLKAQDVKPGDVVSVELTATPTSGKTDSIRLEGPDGWVVWLRDYEMAHVNATLVRRAGRPVKNGDIIIRFGAATPVRFYAWDNTPGAWPIIGRRLDAANRLDAWDLTAGFTHEDGTPIDWEASK